MSGPGDYSVQFTVKVRVLVVFLGVVTFTNCVPSVAVLGMTKLATIFVGVRDVMGSVMPSPTLIDVPAVVKLVPVKVTVTVVPWVPDAGAMLASVACPGLLTVNVRAPLVPPAVVTVTFLPPKPAAGSTTKLAVTFVALT